jgi:alanine racemase
MNNSTIVLDEKSLEGNISFLRSDIGDKVKISAVVKSNAYGHGIEQIVPMMERYGIDHFSVFYYREAIRVYNTLKKPSTIVVMGWISKPDLRDAIEKGIEFFVFDLDRLIKAIKYAKELKLKAKIHLEAETGMNRSGLNLGKLKDAIGIIKENEEYIEFSGFCTHLAGAESVANYYRIQNQLKIYKKMLATLESSKLYPKCKHVANSAAAYIYPKTRMDMIRVGIMLYGFWSSTEVFIHFLNSNPNKTDPLKRILRWQSQIMTIKKVKSGEFVGYGNSFQAQTDITTALVPVGYSLGYSRSLSNKGHVLIHGSRCNLIGIVNMNMIIIDITHIAGVKVGDEVVLIGEQGESEIKVSSFSNLSDELNYEILAHLPESIKRIVKTQ